MVASHESLLTGELVMCEAGLLSDYVTPVLLLAIWGITRDFLMPAKRAQVNFRVAMSLCTQLLIHGQGRLDLGPSDPSGAS